MHTSHTFSKKNHHNPLAISISIFLLGLFALSLFNPVTASGSPNPSADTVQIDGTPIPTPVNKIKDSSNNDLGQIIITDLDVEGAPDYFFSYDTVNIKFEHDDDLEFLGTETPASLDRAEGPSSKISDIVVRLNETVRWSYNDSAIAYVVGLQPYLWPCTIEKMFLNGSLLDESDYYTDYDEAEGGFMYDFENNWTHTVDTLGLENGTFDLTYEYTAPIPVSAWRNYCPGPDQYLINATQIVTQAFHYNITFGMPLNPHSDITARFNLTLPNPADIFNVNVDVVDNKTIDELAQGVFAIHNNEISLYLNLSKERTMDLHFESNFTVKMLEVIDGFWCEDRLVRGVSTRERDYKITITEGPSDLFLNYFWINETNLLFDDITTGGAHLTSALGRTVAIKNMNTSIPKLDHDPFYYDEEEEEEEIEDPIEYIDGVAFVGVASPDHYYLTKGEVDIITLRYRSLRTLSIVIADKIRTPLEGYRINIYLGNQPYGSKINQFHKYPMATKVTDENGVVAVKWVPIGEFTIEIMDKNGNFIANKTADSDTNINFIVTDIEHFPATILVYSGISVFFILLGMIIYKRNI